jgi:predicted O-methyltransferase YrrM
MALDRLPIDDALAGYLDGLAGVPDDLAALYHEMAGDEWAMMMTHPDLGRLLEVLVAATGGRAVLEVGTFVGTSSGWMARALAPGGHIDTLEADEARADRAEAFFRDAGIADRVTVHRGPAAETLPGLADGAYDLCYIDADKVGYPVYLEHAVRLVRPGGLILADNVLSSGRVALPEDEQDERSRALVAFTRAAMDHPRLRTTVLTVGDGVTLSAVRSDARA